MSILRLSSLASALRLQCIVRQEIPGFSQSWEGKSENCQMVLRTRTDAQRFMEQKAPCASLFWWQRQLQMWSFLLATRGQWRDFLPAGTITCLQVKQLGESSSLDTLLEDWLLQGEIIVFKKKHIYAFRKHFSHESWLQDVFPALCNFCLCSCKYTFMPIFQVGQIRGPRSRMTQENTGIKKNTCWTKKIPEFPKESKFQI